MQTIANRYIIDAHVINIINFIKKNQKIFKKSRKILRKNFLTKNHTTNSNFCFRKKILKEKRRSIWVLVADEIPF